MAEPLNATFFAFKKRPEGGGALLGSSVAFSVAVIVLFVVAGAIGYYLLGGPAFVQWYAKVAASGGDAASAEAPPNMSGFLMMVPLYFVAMFLYFVLLASYESACLRWMIRGERSGPLQLCFGADMWRVYGTYWAWFIFFLVTAVLFWIVMVVVGLAAGSASGGENHMATGVIVGVACVLWILAWITTAVRLAPAAATSIGIGHFAPLKAWSASRGRFWALFGAYLLMFIVYLIACVVISAIFFGAYYGTIFGHLDWSQAASDPTAFNRAYEQASMQALQGQFSSPTSIAIYVGGQVLIWAVALVFYVLYYGINARAVEAALAEGKVEHEAPAS